MEKISFSVLIPVYNGEQVIRRCLTSVLSSSYPDFQLIVCDDGSTDRTPELLREFSRLDPRIKVLYHSVNQGRSIAHLDLNRAAENPWSVCIDADDEIAPDFLAIAAAAIAEDPADLLNFPCLLHFANNSKRFIPLPDFRADGKNMVDIFLKNDAYQGAWWSKVFRTEKLQNVCPLTTENLDADDCFFMLPLYASLTSYRYVHTDHPMYTYYADIGQWSSSIYRMTPEKFDLRCRLQHHIVSMNIRFLREHGFSPEDEDRFLKIYHGMDLFMILQHYTDWRTEGIRIFRKWFTGDGNLLSDGSVQARHFAALYQQELEKLAPTPRASYSFSVSTTSENQNCSYTFKL